MPEPPIVFYSWQADSPNATNRGLIRTALEKACVTLAAEPEDAPRVDSDTAGVPGSPDIAQTIFDKIDRAAVFVADVSSIGKTEGGRPTPNPNVLIELGYARAVLGTARVITVMNTAYGQVEELPFDIKGRRVLTYHSHAHDDSRAEARRQLVAGLTLALESALGATIPPTEPIETGPVQSIEGLIPFKHGDHLGDIDPRRTGDSFPVTLESNGQFGFAVFTPVEPRVPMTVREMKELARSSKSVLPIFGNAPRMSFPSNVHGVAAICPPGKAEDAQVLAFGLLKSDSSVIGFDGFLISRSEREARVVRSVKVEKRFNEFVSSVLTFYERNVGNIELVVTVGLSGVERSVLGLRRDAWEPYSTERHYKDVLAYRLHVTDTSANAAEVLRPFYDYLWDCYGLRRPSDGRGG